MRRPMSCAKERISYKNDGVTQTPARMNRARGYRRAATHRSLRGRSPDGLACNYGFKSPAKAFSGNAAVTIFSGL